MLTKERKEKYNLHGASELVAEYEKLESAYNESRWALDTLARYEGWVKVSKRTPTCSGPVLIFIPYFGVEPGDYNYQENTFYTRSGVPVEPTLWKIHP